jgi:hypothetical protein
MKVNYWIGAVVTVGAIATGWTLHSQTKRTTELESPQSVTFRILFGLADTDPTDWDGKVTVSAGTVLSIQGWRFSGNDSSDYQTSWKASTRRGPLRAAATRKKGPDAKGPMLDNGVLIAADLKDSNARYEIATPQGDFAFQAQEIPYGAVKTFLDGRVQVDRVPSTVQLNTSDEEQDHPAIAQSGDDVYVAYVEFTHGDRSKAVQGIMHEEPRSFDFLGRPTGGDQVRLMHYSKATRKWSASEDVSAERQDIMRTAIAVDGKKRIWAFWSANHAGNFDIVAKYRNKGKWSEEMRVTSDLGTDLNPVATTDSEGRVWVAWQAYRNGNLEILAAAQEGDKFSKETIISFSKMSDWDPSIAAGKNGEVAIAWDTYDKGDYDVYSRRMKYSRGISMQKPLAIAASRNFEARVSIAYDDDNRLWAAYEGADAKWGKDFGAYETTGVSLYQNHNIKIKCLDDKGAAFTTPDALADVLPGGAGRRRGQAAAGARSAALPNPALAKNRRPNATPQPGPTPRNSFPRLSTDSKGGLFLAFRTSSAARSPIGSVWQEMVSYFDGEQWQTPMLIPHSDGLLDNRPAMASLGAGHLLLVTASDHRQSTLPGPNMQAMINADLYAAEIKLDKLAVRSKLVPATVEETTAGAEVRPELDQVASMRRYRADAEGRKVQLMRGEFHRHTEMSTDGGNDGPLIDAYRYMIDAAYMDWVGCCDHDNGGGREYYWWTQQKLTDAYKLGDSFVPMFSYERSVRYPEGHRNVVMSRRGIRPLPRLAKMADDSPPSKAPDTQMLYRYLRQFDGIVASHTSGTDMGTDWRDNDPIVEPVVEIYQGDRQNYEMPDAPRSNSAKDSIGGWRPLGFVSLALQKGYRLGFQASSDHVSTHMSYANLWVTEPTREGIMDAFHKRRIYGSTDNILADVRSGSHFMGEEFTTSTVPVIQVKLWGTSKFAKVHIIKDGQYVYAVEPNNKNVDFTWRDAAAQKGSTSYYYVRGEQADGELVWVSPMWITYR